MCLALPGKILTLEEDDGLLMGVVDFAGMQKKICMVYAPTAKVDDYVIVHVGFAISILDQRQAQTTLDLIQEINDEVC